MIQFDYLKDSMSFLMIGIDLMWPGVTVSDRDRDSWNDFDENSLVAIGVMDQV